MLMVVFDKVFFTMGRSKAQQHDESGECLPAECSLDKLHENTCMSNELLVGIQASIHIYKKL